MRQIFPIGEFVRRSGDTLTGQLVLADTDNPLKWNRTGTAGRLLSLLAADDTFRVRRADTNATLLEVGLTGYVYSGLNAYLVGTPVGAGRRLQIAKGTFTLSSGSTYTYVPGPTLTWPQAFTSVDGFVALCRQIAGTGVKFGGCIYIVLTTTQARAYAMIDGSHSADGTETFEFFHLGWGR